MRWPLLLLRWTILASNDRKYESDLNFFVFAHRLSMAIIDHRVVEPMWYSKTYLVFVKRGKDRLMFAVRQ